MNLIIARSQFYLGSFLGIEVPFGYGVMRLRIILENNPHLSARMYNSYRTSDLERVSKSKVLKSTQESGFGNGQFEPNWCPKLSGQVYRPQRILNPICRRSDARRNEAPVAPVHLFSKARGTDSDAQQGTASVRQKRMVGFSLGVNIICQ